MKKTLWLAVAFVGVIWAFGFAEQAEGDLAVRGRYIVVFRDAVADVPGMAYRLARSHGRTPLFVYEHALRGFAVEVPEQAAEALRRNPNVAYVEPDSVVWAFATQDDATWGLDRIDQRDGLDGVYNYNSQGSGVRAYVIDTGIRTTHADFGGRAEYGRDFVDNDLIADDCNGHGTHVAATIGGATYGVAKDVHLVAVRVLGCDGSGTTSGVIAGIDWVTANAFKPAVANMSLGGSASTSLDTAVKNSIAAGIGYTVSAGNGNFIGRAQDACNYSPARVPEAMTISATDSADRKASWANYGNCVDLFAPGVSITSAWIGSNTAANTISGTSMAAPHAAGVAALYLQVNPAAAPAAVRDAIYAATTKGIVADSKTASNHLLYSLVGEGSPTNQLPTASFTYTDTGLSVTFEDTSSDTDGTIAGWLWSFGDGATSTLQNPTHDYSVAGTYTVTLTVTDNAGGVDTVSVGVTVSTAPAGDITLTATGYKVKGQSHVELAWEGATAPSVDVYRNGAVVATTPNDGQYTDIIPKKGGGTFTYKVCEEGSNTCSNTVTVTM